MNAGTPHSYANEKSSIAFLRALRHRVIHLRGVVRDLRRLGERCEIACGAEQDAADSVSPFIARFSPFVMLCAMVEGFVFDTAVAHHEVEPVGDSPESLSGSRAEKAKEYFSKVAGLRFPAGRPSWSDLSRYFLVRHAIVHSLGKITDAGKASAVTSLPGLEVSPAGELWPQAEFLPAALCLVERFVEDMEESLGGRQS